MTAWTDHLARLGARLDGNALAFDDPATEARLVDDVTIAVPLLNLGLIRSVGPDSAPFLHNLVSNEVLKLAADAACWNSFNSPKGRMLTNFLLWPEAEGHALMMSAELVPAMTKKFSMYVLRSKTRVSDASADTALVGLAGPEAAGVLERAGLPLPDAPMKQAGDAGRRCIRIGDDAFVLALAADQAAEVYAALLDAGAARAGTAAWQLKMIRAGVPLLSPATQEEFVAQMVNYDLIGGVSFTKGCYPGQEIVARTRYLGKLKKRMYRVAIPAGAAPEVGTDVFAPAFGEQSAGKLVNVAPAADGGFEALAVLQIAAAEAGDLQLGRPAGAALRVLPLPYPLA
ncbi:CAF17-like 4Fe-4S cluster assembly/insertion protein YgfZ [Thauera phenolivorans]|nr:folate-binding protein YgfZ [Thauera phenolivorans]